MIQSTKKIQYGDLRVGTKAAFIRLEIARATATPNNLLYEIEHFAIIDDETGAKMKIADSSKTLSIQEYNQFSGAVDSVIKDFDTTALNAFEIEQLRLKLGLLLYVKNDFLKDDEGNNTEFVVWGVLPNEFDLV